MEARKGIFLKTSSLTDVQRDLLKKVMIKEFMSSEESGEDDEEGEKKSVIKVKPLPWRSSRIDRFFKQLDKKACKSRTKQSKQQTLKRVIGCVSM